MGVAGSGGENVETERHELDVATLDLSIEELELSVRTATCFQDAEVRHIGQLVQMTEVDLLRTKNFGRKSLKEVREVLSEMGLELGTKLEDWTPPSGD